MIKFISIIDKILSTLCTLLSVMLVISVIWQVFSRFVLNEPNTYTDELARFAFIWVGLIGAAYALGQKKHLAIGLLATKLESSPIKHKRLNLIINVITLCFVILIMCYGGLKLVNDTLAVGQISPVLGIEMGLIYAAIPLSGFFMLIYTIRDLFNCLQSPSSIN